ncbi:MAG: hypothetical protein IM600_17375 [Bacteroidetes bacterium]|nr:hypothetical protein [Bacteroidota bacterium]MCA6445203.1 hypothetical protein [Bacteroidota bacterium]
MRISLKYFYIVSLMLFAHDLFSQGLRNNGARIVFSGGGQIYIDGATGNYSNTAGGLITPSASSTITLLGNWVNNGGNNAFFSDGGGVVLAGAAQTIGGTNASAFFNLSLQGTGTKQLTVNQTTVGGQSTFNGVLSLGTRPLDLNNNTLNVTNQLGGAITQTGGYIISETNAATNPSIVRWYVRTSAGPHIVPFGTTGGVAIPFTYNITAPMASASGNVELSTRPTALNDNQPWTTGVGFMFCPNNGTSANPCAIGSVIDRWWQVNNSNPVTADLTFTYRGVENTMTNAPTGNIGAQYWTGAGWLLDNASFGSAAGVIAGTGALTAPGMTASGPYVLTSKLVPLPIEILRFVVNCENSDYYSASFELANENGIVNYEVLNSKDALDFKKIAEVLPNSTNNGNYSVMLDKKSVIGNYFKLKSTNHYSQNDYSAVVTLSKECQNETSPVIYAHHSNIIVKLSSTIEKSLQLNVIDAAGKLLKSEKLSITKGQNEFSILAPYAKGLYFVSLQEKEVIVLTKKVPLED